MDGRGESRTREYDGCALLKFILSFPFPLNVIFHPSSSSSFSFRDLVLSHTSMTEKVLPTGNNEATTMYLVGERERSREQNI